MNEITEILSALRQGDAAAARRLFPLVYDELRQMAMRKLRQEKPGQTLEPTALVHEMYLRLIDGEHRQRWDSRGHFFAACAEAMRRILIDRARRRHRPKHGGDRRRLQLDEVQVPARDDHAKELVTRIGRGAD